MCKSSDGKARFIIESLRFDKNTIIIFEPDSVVFGLFPSELMGFGIEIKRQEAKVMASKIVFIAWVTKTNDEFHREMSSQVT